MAFDSRPNTVFRELSECIRAEFGLLQATVADHFSPQHLTRNDVVSLCVRKEDEQYLRRAWNECSDRVMPKYTERMQTTLKSDGVVKDYRFIFIVHNAGADFCLCPNYAGSNAENVPIHSAPPELVNQLASDLEQWLDAARNIALAEVVFDKLDKDPRTYTREKLRYVFPAILPLLRRVGKRLTEAVGTVTSREQKLGHEAIKWADKLSVPLVAHHTTIDPRLRNALQMANTIVPMYSLLELKQGQEREVSVRFSYPSGYTSKHFIHSALPDTPIADPAYLFRLL